MKVKKKAKIRNRYNQKPHLTRDTILESDKYTRKHHTQNSQEVSPFPAGDHNAAGNRQDSKITNVKHKQQKGSSKEAPLWNGQYKQEGQVALMRSPEFCLKLAYRYL